MAQYEIEPETGSTLRNYIGVLWRRKWIVLVPTILVPLATLLATLRQAPVYEGRAQVLATRQELAASSIVGETPAFDDIDRTAFTQAALAHTPAVAARVLRAAGVEESTREFLRRASVNPQEDILYFAVRDRHPETALALVNAYARVYTQYRRELGTRALSKTIAQLRSQIDQLVQSEQGTSRLATALRERQSELEALQTLLNSNVSVVRTATPADVDQVAPRPLRNTALGLVAGLLIGIICAFLWEALDTRVHSGRDAEAALGLPLLARLRDTSRRPRAADLPTLIDPGSEAAEAYHVLRLNLQLANADHGARSILVTSPRAGEGVARTSANLAVAFARAGRRVTLVDLELGSPAVTRIFGLEDRPGLSTVVTGRSSVADAVTRITLLQPDAHGGSLGGMLEVLGSGEAVAQPTELLSSRALEAALAELRGRTDLVLAAAPPMLGTGGATALGMSVDAVLLVVQERSAHKPVLGEARRLLEAWPCLKLGFALSAAPEEPAAAGRAASAPSHRLVRRPPAAQEATWR
jgi:polysaccharide biosynthesis transport protein